MAENTTINSMSGGDVIATDELSTLNGSGSTGVKVQRVKVGFGADNDLRDTDATHPLPAGLIDAVVTAQNLSTASTSNAQSITGLNGFGSAAIQITGTWTGTLTPEGTVDGTNWFTTPIFAIGGNGALVTTVTANGQWIALIAGYVGFRLRCTTTGTGTAVVSIRGTEGSLVANQVNVALLGGVAPIADNGGFTDGTTPTLPAGFIFDEVAGTSLTENDIGAARMDTKRAVVGVLEDETTRGQRATVNSSKGLAVTPIPHTAGGLSISRTLSAASTNATNVKASAGQVFAIYAHNINAAVRYLKLYNKASSPTVGTDTPVMTLPIPGNTAGAGFVMEVPMGIAFATGISFAITTGVADSDTGGVAANDIVVNILYK